MEIWKKAVLQTRQQGLCQSRPMQKPPRGWNHGRSQPRQGKAQMCPFGGNLFGTSAAVVWGLFLAGSGRRARLGPVGVLWRRVLYLRLVMGVPGAGGSCLELCPCQPHCPREARRGGTTVTGVVFRLREPAWCPPSGCSPGLSAFPGKR